MEKQEYFRKNRYFFNLLWKSSYWKCGFFNGKSGLTNHHSGKTGAGFGIY